MTEDTTKVSASWILSVFEYVAHHLLGWALDPDKPAVGSILTLLGLQITMDARDSRWQFSPDKATEWCADIKQFLRNDRLLPSEASKLAGRLTFLNCHVYSRLGRALLPPIIWRQIQVTGGSTESTTHHSSSWSRKTFCKGIFSVHGTNEHNRCDQGLVDLGLLSASARKDPRLGGFSGFGRICLGVEICPCMPEGRVRHPYAGGGARRLGETWRRSSAPV